MEKGKQHLYVRGALIVATLVATIAFVGTALTNLQTRQAINSVQEQMRATCVYLPAAASAYEASGKSVEGWIDRNHERYLTMIIRMMSEDPKLQSSDSYLKKMCTLVGAEDLMVIDRDGSVLSSAVGSVEDFGGDDFAPLLLTFETKKLTKMTVMSKAQALEEMQSGVYGADDEADTEESAKRNRDPIFYALAIDEEHACVVNDYGMSQMLYIDVTDPWEHLLSNMVVGGGGFVFAYTDDTGEILYYPDRFSVVKGKPISELGVDIAKIKDCQFVTETVDGEELYLFGVHVEDRGAWIVCAMPMEELTENKSETTMLSWTLYAILSISCAVYAIALLKKRAQDPRGDVPSLVDEGDEVGVKRRLVVFSCFCMLVFSLASFYQQTLYLISNWSSSAAIQVSIIEQKVQLNEVYQESFKSYYAQSEQKVLDLVAWYLEHYPEKFNAKTIDELLETLQFEELSVTDADSNVLLAAFSSSQGQSPQLQAVPTLDMQSPLRNEDGVIDGSVVATVLSPVLEVVEGKMSLAGILETVQLGRESFAFSISTKSKEFSWHPDPAMVGKSALDYGIKEDDLKNHLSTYLFLDGESYYVVSGQIKDDLFYLAIQKDALFRGLLPLVLSEAAMVSVCLLLIGVGVYTLPASGRGRNRVRLGSFVRKRTAEQVAFMVLFAGFALVGVWLLLGHAFFDQGALDNVLDFVLSGTWEYGVNEFALTASLILILEASLILLVIRILARLLSQILPSRAATAVKMLTSLVSYATVFFVSYRCLVYFGMNPEAVMASAGIVSIVIGIGANSLVGDVIAGIFLLMEGNVHVGNMILIGDFRGRVEEIGIRMTKVYDVDSYITKIIPNSEIQNVVNMSTQPAAIRMEFMISYEEDLKRVEKLLVAELKSMEGAIEGMEGCPEYCGITELGDNGVVLFIKVKGDEEKREGIEAEINRRVYLMFGENDIEVPYPQLTLHSAEPEQHTASQSQEGQGHKEA